MVGLALLFLAMRVDMLTFVSEGTLTTSWSSPTSLTLPLAVFEQTAGMFCYDANGNTFLRGKWHQINGEKCDDKVMIAKMIQIYRVMKKGISKAVVVHFLRS